MGRLTNEQLEEKFYNNYRAIFDDEEYIILEADTREHLAFDVNKFREVNDVQEPYTQGENEIIFPMYKENIKEYRMTINEFVSMKEMLSDG